MHPQEVMSGDDPSLGPVDGVSVGVVVQDTPSHITLAMDYWETGDFRHLQSIVRTGITAIKYISVK